MCIRSSAGRCSRFSARARRRCRASVRHLVHVVQLPHQSLLLSLRQTVEGRIAAQHPLLVLHRHVPMLIQPRLQVAGRRVTRRRIPRVRWPRRVRPQVRRSRIPRPRRVPRRGRTDILRNRWLCVCPNLRLRIGPPLGLGIRPALRLRIRTPLRLVVGTARILRPWLRLTGRLVVRLGSGTRRRRRRRVRRLVMLPLGRHRQAARARKRGRKSRAAPRFRPAYALHVHPGLTFQSPNFPIPSHARLQSDFGLVSVQIVIVRHPPARKSIPADPATARCCPASADRPLPRLPCEGAACCSQFVTPR